MNFLAFTHFFMLIYLKLTNNSISIKKMFFQYLLLPWTLFGVVLVYSFKVALSSSSGTPMSIIIHIIMPIYFLYMFLINFIITAKCYKLPNSIKKYVALFVFSLLTLFTFISFSMFSTLSIMSFLK